MTLERQMLAMTAGFLTILCWPTLPTYWVAGGFLLLAILLVKTHCLAASFIAGLSICIISINYHFTDLKTLLTANSSIKGEIVSLPVQGKHHNRFYFDLSQIDTGTKTVESNSRVQVTWRGQHQLSQGQTLILNVKAKPITGLFNQGTFNYQRFLLSNDVVASVNVIEGEIISDAPNLRARLAQRFDIIADKYKTMRFMRALIIGDKRYFSNEDWQILQRTGTSHLFAISGLHLGFVCLMAMLLVGPLLRLCIRHNQLATISIMVCTVLVGVFYSLLAGFSYPTIRALIMLIVASCFVCLGQRVGMGQIIAMSLFVIGLFNPLGFLSQGLWLSIFALICVVTSSKWLEKDMVTQKVTIGIRIWYWCLQLLKLQLALVLGLCGIQMVFFGGISLVAPMANVIAVPVITILVLPLVLLATIGEFLLLAGVSELLFNGADTLLITLFELLSWLSKAPFVWQGMAFSRWLVVIIGFATLLFILKTVNAKAWLYLLSLPIILLSIVLAVNFQQETDTWRIDFLDVGHGNSSVIQKGNRGIIIDTGNVLGEHSTIAQRIVIPFIEQREIAQIDYIFVTHHDADHNAGLTSLIERFPKATVITNKDDVCEGGVIDWQGLVIKLIKAKGKLPKSHNTENNKSCLIHINNAIGSVLFSGDIEKRAEKLLIKQLDSSWQAQVLQVPHHGSKTSSTSQFIELIDPTFAVVSTASFNQWHFPATLVTNRYRRAKARMLNTAEIGQITVEFSADGPYITNYRRQRSPFWYNGDLSFGHYQR